MSSDDDPVHIPLSLSLSSVTSEVGGFRKCLGGGVGGTVVIVMWSVTLAYNKCMHAHVGGEDLN